MAVPLSCLVCGRELDAAFHTEVDLTEPYEGVQCSTHGNYGSKVFDPSPTYGAPYLVFNLCDDCLVVAAKQGRVELARRIDHPEFQHRLWSGGEFPGF